MDDEDFAGLLDQFGLSDKEIDTYLAILEQGESKASTIADAADVSKRYVYSISEELEDRGLVEVNDHSVPTVVRPRPPEEVVDRLSQNLETLEPEIRTRYSAERTEDQVEVIKARQTALKRLENLIGEAETEVTLSIPVGVFSQVRSALESAVDRGVLVLLLLGDVDEEPEVVTLAGAASTVRTWGELVPTMLTVDQRHGLLAPSQLLTTSMSESNAISLTQEQLIPTHVGSFLANYWPTADEQYVATPDELPRTYEGFRNAVFQIALHDATDSPIEVSVEGEPIGDRDLPSTLTGEVVSVSQSLVRPMTSTLPINNSFVLGVDGDRVSVGGGGAFLEDFEAETVTLRRSDE